MVITDLDSPGRTLTLLGRVADPPATADRLYVTQLYRHLFGRAPDAAGLAWWIGQLRQGAARPEVAAELARSARDLEAEGRHLERTLLALRHDPAVLSGPRYRPEVDAAYHRWLRRGGHDSRAWFVAALEQGLSEQG